MTVDTIGTVAVGSLGNSTLKSLENIVLEVLGILNTAAETDKVVKDTNSLTLLLRNTSVGHAAWHLAQAFDTTQGLGKCKDSGQLAETLGRGVTPTDAE